MKQCEAADQAALFAWAEYSKGKYPELESMYAIPNGGKRDKIEAAHLKKQGVKSGVPDICLPVARGGYHALYIEMKHGQNKPTQNQKRWISALRKLGNAAEVCYGVSEAKRLIVNYLNREAI